MVITRQTLSSVVSRVAKCITSVGGQTYNCVIVNVNCVFQSSKTFKEEWITTCFRLSASRGKRDVVFFKNFGGNFKTILPGDLLCAIICFSSG